MERKNPLGVDDFRLLSTEYYYCDKTRLIEDIVNKGPGKVYLFNRPRRFGKSAVLSMLSYFFDNRHDNRDLFRRLYIGSSPCVDECGKYPVVHINTKDFEVSSEAEMYARFGSIVQKLYREYDLLLMSPNLKEEEKKNFAAIALGTASKNELSSALADLTGYLYRHYHAKVVVLIDEYDAPLMNAFENGFFPEATRFFKNTYSQLLKSNEAIQFAVLTGVLKVSKINLFSGLNNLIVDNGITTFFDEYFGFTEAETRALLRYFKAEDQYDDVLSWYGGYRFSKTVVNPWSVLSFLDAGRIYRPYWNKTGGNRLFDHFFSSVSFEEAADDILALVQGGAVYCAVNENYDFEELNDLQTLLNYMLSTGYLTPLSYDGINAYLQIPNKEVVSVFQSEVLAKYQRRFKTSNRFITDLRLAFINGDEDKVRYLLGELLKMVVTVFDFSKEEPYQVFVAVLGVFLFDECKVQREAFVGEGRCDIILYPREGKNFGAVVEIKHEKTNLSQTRLDASALNAIKQIENRRYGETPLLNEAKTLHYYGLSFYKQRVGFAFKKIR